MANIMGAKLVSGEDVIGDITVDDLGRLCLKDPVGIRLFPPKVPGGSPNMSFAPFPSFADQKPGSVVHIEPLHVVYTYLPVEEIIMQYNSIFGSGIITPATKQIITG